MVSLPEKQELSEFCRSVGACRVRLVLFKGDTCCGQFEGLRPYFIIGRSPSSSIQVDDQDVSWRHAYLQFVAGRLYCVDLDSRTGTRIEPAMCDQGWVEPGQHIRVGNHRLVVEYEKTGSALALPVRSDPTLSDPELKQTTPVAIEFLNTIISGTAERTWPFDRVLTLVGKTSRCKIRFQDEAVSTFHCSLVYAGSQVWIVDLLGNRGVIVNGEHRRHAKLQSGDVVTIGPYCLRIRDRRVQRMDGSSQVVPASPLPDTADQGASLMQRLFVMMQEQITPLAGQPAEANWAGGKDANLSEIRKLLEAVLGQFSTSQMQMMQQFQQMMAALLTSFGEFNARQTAAFNEELKRLHKVNEEILQVRRAIEHLRAGKPVRIKPRRKALQGSPEVRCDDEQAVRKQIPPTRSDGPASNLTQVDDDTQSERDPSTDVQQPVEVDPQDLLGEAEIASAAAAASREGTQGAEQSGETELAPDEVHDWLSKRLVELERKRTGIWKRLGSWVTRKG